MRLINYNNHQNEAAGKYWAYFADATQIDTRHAVTPLLFEPGHIRISRVIQTKSSFRWIHLL